MRTDHTERLFKWIDLIRWVLYGLVAGAVALAVWATKIQLSIADIRNDVDALTEKEVPEEHRLTVIENNIEWIKDGMSRMRH